MNGREILISILTMMFNICLDGGVLITKNIKVASDNMDKIFLCSENGSDYYLYNGNSIMRFKNGTMMIGISFNSIQDNKKLCGCNDHKKELMYLKSYEKALKKASKYLSLL